jgi:hypothetical protein
VADETLCCSATGRHCTQWRSHLFQDSRCQRRAACPRSLPNASLHDPKLSRALQPDLAWTCVPISPPSPAEHVVVVVAVVVVYIKKLSYDAVCISGNRKLAVLFWRRSGKRTWNTFAAICVACCECSCAEIQIKTQILDLGLPRCLALP